jgi:hypothetical protein
MSNAAYTLGKARYAKNSMALRAHDGQEGLKGRCARLAEALNGKWSNREKAYIMSESKARRFESLYAAGTDARLSFNSGCLHSAQYELDCPEKKAARALELAKSDVVRKMELASATMAEALKALEENYMGAGGSFAAVNLREALSQVEQAQKVLKG